MATSYFFLKILKDNQSTKNLCVELPNDRNLTSNSVNSIKQCRICLKEGSVPIFSNNNNSYPDISNAVKTFGNIKINKDDSFPKFLCEKCHSLLQGAILFRKLAKETETGLIKKKCNKSRALLNHKTLSNVSVANISFNRHVDETMSHRCNLCKLNFKSYKDYLVHNNSKHRKVRIQCPICHSLLTSQLYKRHLARHQSVSHMICEVCGKLYRKDNLVRHLQLHNYDLPYQCQICPYKGRFMESLKIHVRSHYGDKPFSCLKCNLRFLTRSNLNRHLLTHKKDKPYKCVECNRTFYTQRDVDVHVKSDHSGMKEYTCEICDNKYDTRKALLRHELRVHKRDKMCKGRKPLYLQPEFRK